MSDLLSAPNPIRTVLVANRGEIAVRVMRTCRRLGVRTVAVYSEADVEALHVSHADDAVYIGPAPATQSYLDIEAIIAAAKAGGADAVHPGYGFLSENADFAQACADAGLIFIGPQPDVIARMGSKIVAKNTAIAAGVPVVPGFQKVGATKEELHAAARQIGYPVLVKASAGGGGRGMRRVDREEDLATALASAEAEARSAFGEGALLIEKFVERPRHLEVQIFGDSHGNVVHLHERDCSVQRNNQKVLEEAPAPNLPPEVRRTLLTSAVNLAREMGYRSAGTVEYILPPGGDVPYFLEVNTRLQVEHPVTEEVTGIDLVEWQLREAAGLPIPLTQEQIRVKGHAIEARLSAERPEANFAPAIGEVVSLSIPPTLRFDSGIAAASRISPHYDSMVAKVIVYGANREAAVERLSSGLRTLHLLGLETNQAFLADCVEAKAFATGQATTAFLADTFADGWSPDPDLLLKARGLAALACMVTHDGGTPLLRRDGFRVTGQMRPARAHFHIEDRYGECGLTLTLGPNGIGVEAGEHSLSISEKASPRAALDDALWRVEGETVLLAWCGIALKAEVLPASEAHAVAAASHKAPGDILAPLPGLITSIAVAEGQTVAAGDIIATMEAMKLVHSLAAPADGIVRKIHQAAGDTVTAKALIIEMEE